MEISGDQPLFFGVGFVYSCIHSCLCVSGIGNTIASVWFTARYCRASHRSFQAITRMQCMKIHSHVHHDVRIVLRLAGTSTDFPSFWSTVFTPRLYHNTQKWDSHQKNTKKRRAYISMRVHHILHRVYCLVSIHLHPAHACIQRPPHVGVALGTKNTPENTVHDSRDA